MSWRRIHPSWTWAGYMCLAHKWHNEDVTVILKRKLRLPLRPEHRYRCNCGMLVDVFGDHALSYVSHCKTSKLSNSQATKPQLKKNQKVYVVTPLCQVCVPLTSQSFLTTCLIKTPGVFLWNALALMSPVLLPNLNLVFPGLKELVVMNCLYTETRREKEICLQTQTDKECHTKSLFLE